MSVPGAGRKGARELGGWAGYLRVRISSTEGRRKLFILGAILGRVVMLQAIKKDQVIQTEACCQGACASSPIPASSPSLGSVSDHQY